MTLNKQFQKYAQLRTEVEELTKEYKALGESILSNLTESTNTEYGQFVLGTSTVYTYPEAVKVAEDKVKALKEKFRKNGQAVPESKRTLVYKPLVELK